MGWKCSPSMHAVRRRHVGAAGRDRLRALRRGHLLARRRVHVLAVQYSRHMVEPHCDRPRDAIVLGRLPGGHVGRHELADKQLGPLLVRCMCPVQRHDL